MHRGGRLELYYCNMVEWSWWDSSPFDTVGLVIWPVKIVPDMTYNVFGGTLNVAQSIDSDYCIFKPRRRRKIYFFWSCRRSGGQNSENWDPAAWQLTDCHRRLIDAWCLEQQQALAPLTCMPCTASHLQPAQQQSNLHLDQSLLIKALHVRVQGFGVWRLFWVFYLAR